jgi:hypothetical protein
MIWLVFPTDTESIIFLPEAGRKRGAVFLRHIRTAKTLETSCELPPPTKNGKRKYLSFVFVRYRAAELPALTQWKMLQAGVYVGAIEPCTSHEGPRELRRFQGCLRDLAPGESVHYQIEIGIENSTR